MPREMRHAAKGHALTLLLATIAAVAACWLVVRLEWVR
jgi:hypothetical protein